MLACTSCRASLPPEALIGPGPARCGRCGASLEISVFPALFRPLGPGEAAEAVLSEQESACFYHPRKRAVVPCESCGRFLCALCDLELNGRHTCAPCLEAARGRGEFTRLENQRTRYDRIAMALAGYPLLLFFYPTLMTAPVALYMSIRALRAPGSLVHRTRIRCVLAMLLATAEIVAWVLLINLIVTQLRTAG
jgi:hypothetical protein